MFSRLDQVHFWIIAAIVAVVLILGLVFVVDRMHPERAPSQFDLIMCALAGC